MLTRIDRLVAAAIIAAVVFGISFVGFEPLGADCGDAPVEGPVGEEFRCNTAGYVLLALGFLSAAGLAVLLVVVAGRSWVRRRRRRDSA